MQIKSVLIVGYGVVGHNLEKQIASLSPDIYDKYKIGYDIKNNKKYDLCFICVDTPFTENSVCDISQVEEVLQENESSIYIIKSTILPGTTDSLIEKYKKVILFSPEYYGNTPNCLNYEFSFTILGGKKDACIEAQTALQRVYDGRHRFILVDSKTAELVKYMENSFLATKVSFCNQFFDISQKIGVDYETLRELFILDPRVNPSHTFVYRDQLYYDSHCLNKDIPAIIDYAKQIGCDISFLESMKEYNDRRKNINNG